MFDCFALKKNKTTLIIKIVAVNQLRMMITSNQLHPVSNERAVGVCQTKT